MKKHTKKKDTSSIGFNDGRHTKVRRALIEIFTAISHPLSVPELLERLERQALDVNKTTIYRQLESLRKREVVKEIPIADHALHYELIKENDHHHHLICVKCHTIEDVSFSEDLKRQEQLILRKQKFLVKHHSLEFYGYCKRCH